MPWVKLDDQFPFNRKAIIAGKDGRALYVTALCWTSGQLTDGIIDDAAVPMLAAVSEVADAQATAAHLVATGLWERIPGGYEIHDYHDYNPSSGEVRAMREARAEAGRRGGLASVASKSQANAQANVEQNSTPSPSPSPSPSPGPNPSLAAAAAAPASEPDAVAGHLFRLVESRGILPDSYQSQLWLELLDITRDTKLLNAAFHEAAVSSNRTPTPKFLRAILERCVNEGVAPGVRSNGARAPDRPTTRPASELPRVYDGMERVDQ